MDIFLALFSGAALGLLHAFDIDHLVAVATFSGKDRTMWASARMGAMWGLGHTLVLLLVGAILIVFRLSIPDIVQDWSEIFVGVLLVGLGLWTVRSVLRRRGIHIHRHAHDGAEHIHFHSHTADPANSHDHSHSLFALGAVHGFAGTGSVVVMIPVALADSWIPGITFLVVFGLGSMVSMAAFSVVLTRAVTQARSERFLLAAQGMAGLASFTVGLFWIAERML